MDYCLESGEHLLLDSSVRGLTICCSAGRLWVTQSGDTRDHVLTPGQEFTVRQGGRVIIEAIGRARGSFRRGPCPGAGLSLRFAKPVTQVS